MMKHDRGQRKRSVRGHRLLLLCAAVLLAAGCGIKTERTAQTDAAGREKLVVWSYFETQAQRGAMDRLMRDFNQAQNRYEILWEYVPMTEFERSLSSAYTENNLPDMAILDNPDMPVLIRLGMFEDITAQVLEWRIPEEYYPSAVETTEYEGHYYGVPFDCNNTALIYNRQMLEEKNIDPPKTWEELREAAKALTTEECCGFLISGISGEQGAFQLLSWLLAAGEDVSTLGGEATVEAYEFLQSMIRDGSLPENCINLTQTDVSREFAQGKAAMMQNGPWAIPELEDAGIDFGILPIPGRQRGMAVTGGENIGILKGKNVEGSLEFIRFCMESDSLYDFCESSNVLPCSEEKAKKAVEQNPVMRSFEEQMHSAVTRTSIHSWGSVAPALTQGLFGIVSEDMTPREAAEGVRTTQLKNLHLS